MVKHIILWNIKEEFTAQQRLEHAAKIKEGLEALQGVISGLIKIQVITSPLETGNADLMLDSLFENEQALAGYQIHPEHQKVAAFVRSVTCNRMCMDYHLD